VSEWTPEVGVNTETTRADGVAYGADARLEYRGESFYAFAGYGWSRVRYEAETGSLGAWIDGEIFSYSPSHDRRHQVNAVASYDFLDVTASLSWEYGSGRPYTQLYAFDFSVDVPDDRPADELGTAQAIYERPYGARLPVYHRLDVSLERTFSLAERLSLKGKIGAINVYDRRNIFYYDTDTLQRVNQSPLLPYVSLKITTK
jgi:hypothetical protein